MALGDSLRTQKLLAKKDWPWSLELTGLLDVAAAATVRSRHVIFARDMYSAQS